ncbi:MAG: secretin N-terminal domain-containing protein [Candidatus Melainabacteria bacterium]
MAFRSAGFLHQQVIRGVAAFLTAAILGAGGLPVLAATPSSGVLSADVRITVKPTDLDRLDPILGSNHLVTLSLHGVSVQDAFRALAKQGGFSVVVDESVEGLISVDLNQVTIGAALETLKVYSNLTYSVQGNTLVVAAADSDRGISLARNSSAIIPLKNTSAGVIANLLNKTVFNADSKNTVLPDFHSNSLLVVGTSNDIETVKKHVEVLDAPREIKTWRLSHANALDVATLLASSLFNEGIPSLMLPNSGAAAGGGGGAAGGGNDTTAGNKNQIPATMRVVHDNVDQAEGTSDTSATGGGDIGDQVANSARLQSREKANETLLVNPKGALIIPDTRLNTITLLGTAHQIAMTDSLIPTLDRKLPQVVLEASLIEITDNRRNELGFNSGGILHKFSFGTNQTQSAGTNLINNPVLARATGIATSSTVPLETIMHLTSNPVIKTSDLLYQLNALSSTSKVKILANPTITAAHDSDSVISIVDEVVRSATTTANAVGTAVGVEVILGEVGIVLGILPHIGANGNVSMRIKPTISTVNATTTDRFGNLITLLTKRESIVQNVTVHDGESFVLSGLVNNTNTDTVARTPFLSDLPILGALARNSTRTGKKSELLIVITPHVISDESDATHTATGGPMQPVNLSSGFKVPGNHHFAPINWQENEKPAATASPNSLPPLEAPRSLYSQYTPEAADSNWGWENTGKGPATSWQPAQTAPSSIQHAPATIPARKPVVHWQQTMLMMDDQPVAPHPAVKASHAARSEGATLTPELPGALMLNDDTTP